MTKDHKLVFVEFKNGFMDKKSKFAIQKKIYDSIVILTDILDQGISHLKDHMEYILVYNESVNAAEQDVMKKKKYAVQHSESYRAFTKSVSKLAKNEYIYFGIDFFENYCFRKVHTYSKEEFEEYLKNN